MPFDPERRNLREFERGERRLKVWSEDWPLKKPFRIARTVYTHSKVIVVELNDGKHAGRGEAAGVDYKGETQETMTSQIWENAQRLLDDFSIPVLQHILPPGGARNAVDCAHWDIAAKKAGRRIWDLLDIQKPRAVQTYLTIGIDTPEEMARIAAQLARDARIKVKLGDKDDEERLRQIRKVQPGARIIVDANQGWKRDRLQVMMPIMRKVGVKMIEQPLPAEDDEALLGFNSPIPICADEACQTVPDLSACVGKYQMINIKLDKTGGLSTALALAEAGRAAGLGIMIGSNEPTSLGLAPAWIIGQTANIADLDGHWLNAHDRCGGFGDTARLDPFPADLWG